MATIERTAYPRFKNNISQKELNDKFTPLTHEVSHAHIVARGNLSVINYLVLLKSFQNLGYFPSRNEIPDSVVRHIKKQLNLENISDGIENVSKNTFYNHHTLIREYLEVKKYNDEGQKLVESAVIKNAYVMENPADLINSAIDILIKNRFELPAYYLLDKTVLSIKTSIYNNIFSVVYEMITEEQKYILNKLLNIEIDKQYSDLKYFKEPTKKTTFKNMKELITKLNLMESLGDFDGAIKDIPYTKLKHFSAEVEALDISELKDYSDEKKYTMLISFIVCTRAKLRDNLVDMFLKCISKVNNNSKEYLNIIHEKLRPKTENIVSAFTEVLINANDTSSNEDLGEKIRILIQSYGGQESLFTDCSTINAFKDNNYFLFMHKFLKNQRINIFRLFDVLKFASTTQDNSLINCIEIIKKLYFKRRAIKSLEIIEENIDLSFASENWKKTICLKKNGKIVYLREHLETCVFNYLATELKCGDVYVDGAEEYSDYRKQLLPWEECKKELSKYCGSLGLKDEADSFVNQLKDLLNDTATEVDNLYPGNKSLEIDYKGHLKLNKYTSKTESKRIKELESKILEHMPERNILEILSNTVHWFNWTRHFSPISGSDPKIENSTEKYIYLSFSYGSNLGPVQAAKHLNGRISSHTISFLNSRHVTPNKLDLAWTDIINNYNLLELTSFWGNGKLASADGTLVGLSNNNIISEYHIRYGRDGGIMFHLLSDKYIALMGTFIPCGAWEAVYLLDLFLKNKSDIQPDTIHGDTQEQSGTVFALAYLLGINLMPRIRNWKDLNFYRPSKDVKYKHIDSLFKDTIDWELIKTHWKDIFQVVISIKEGKILPSTLLKKLNTKSRKNRLFHAFRELGMAIRTIFLLRYIIDMNLRQQITANTNKVEAYNGFIAWLRFGGEGMITSNSPIEQEKRIKYSEVVASAIIWHNTIDMTNAINKLIKKGYRIIKGDLESIGPLMTRNIRRFGVYDVNFEIVPEPIQREILVE